MTSFCLISNLSKRKYLINKSLRGKFAAFESQTAKSGEKTYETSTLAFYLIINELKYSILAGKRG